jgi:pyridoxal phosphate enzyme (YggS family)
MPESALSGRLDRIRDRIRDAQARGGWDHPVRVIAVTKTHGPEAVRAAVAAGLDAVGENRVQEALAKQDACADVSVEWHLIGSLQRNKVRHAAGRFALIHSVDRLDLAGEIDRRRTGAPQPVLVQVNCSAEPQKGGVEPDGLLALLDAIRELPGILVRGLMTMAAFDVPAEEARRTFRQLRTLRDQAAQRGHDLPELSMGMSDDYPTAVEEGATMIRLGTALFGAREAR